LLVAVAGAEEALVAVAVGQEVCELLLVSLFPVLG
tara:strand:+ start:325 stop:429 length:105 start_codon:yes stop_codon:yes gene_type:complete